LLLLNKSVFATGFLLLASCSEQGFIENVQRDSFQQNRRNAVDLLVVIDNSCSMVEEQDNLANNFQQLVNVFEDADVDWRIAATTTDTEADRYRGLLIGGDDEIILRTDAGEIDRVEYDRDWEFTAGTSLQLSPDKFVWNSNDFIGNWCASTSNFGDGSHGSPGTWNPDCTGAATTPPTGDDAGPVAPGPGDLVITEIMAWSGGLDSKCEWFEMTNVTPDTLDVAGLRILDSGRNDVALPEGSTIAPFQAAVVGRTLDSGEACGAHVDFAFASGMTLNQDVRWIDRETPDNEELFSEMVAQGTGGTGIEMGLEGARLVFEEPYYSASNQGFLRGDHREAYDTPDDDGEEANLSVLIVSDEEDYSPYSVDAHVRYLTNLKGDAAYRDRALVNISGVVGKDPPPQPGFPSCESDAGIATYGSRYLDAINQTQGLAESICAEDFAPIVSELGLTLSGLALDFELSEYPKLESLTVSLYANEDKDSLVRELVRDVDYTYVADGNKIHFDPAQVPPSEYWIVAEYHVNPAPNVDTDGGTN
jgi:hypothetical protein